MSMLAADRVARPFGQLTKFVVVGAGNTLLSLVVYRLLLDAGTPYVLGAALAFAAGAVNGYVWNRRWTFAARDSLPARAKYLAVQLGGLASTSFLVWVAGEGFGLPPVHAYLSAIPPVTLAMFGANRSWTFAMRK